MLTLLVWWIVTGALAAGQTAPVPAAGRLTGQVIESGSNAPLADARVTLVPAASRVVLVPGATGPTMPVRPSETTSDQNGRFAFDNVAPGTYRLQVQKSGFATPTPLSGVPPPPPPINVVAGETREAPALVLLRGGAISGHVLGASNAPIADARVAVLRRTGQAGGQGALLPAGNSAQTNDLGEFRVFGLAPGEYYVQAAPRTEAVRPGSVPQARGTLLAPTYFPSTLDQGDARAVTVVSGQTTPDVSIKLVQAPAFQISGIVVDETGAPVAGAAIMVTPDRSSGASPLFTPMLSGIRSDSAGQFSVRNLIGGTYMLSAAVPVVLNRPAPGNSLSGGSSSVIGGSIVGGISGSVGGIGGPLAGGSSVVTETVNGVTTEYRATSADQVRVAVSDNVSDLRLVARRTR